MQIYDTFLVKKSFQYSLVNCSLDYITISKSVVQWFYRQIHPDSGFFGFSQLLTHIHKELYYVKDIMYTQLLHMLTKIYPYLTIEFIIKDKDYEYVTFMQDVGLPPSDNDSYILVPINSMLPIHMYNCEWELAKMTPIQKIDYNRKLPTVNQVETFKQRINKHYGSYEFHPTRHFHI